MEVAYLRSGTFLRSKLLHFRNLQIDYFSASHFECAVKFGHSTVELGNSSYPQSLLDIKNSNSYIETQS